jgi:hypothetical protein
MPYFLLQRGFCRGDDRRSQLLAEAAGELGVAALNLPQWLVDLL